MAMFTKLASYWATIFVLPLTCANFTDVCNETYSSTKGLQCFPCQPGYAKTDDCSTNQTYSQCIQCKEGTYQPHCISANETEQCRNCTKCAVYIAHCTIYKNAVCRESDSTKDGLDDNWDQTWVLLIVILWAFATLLFASFLSTCLYRKRRMRRRHSSNNINNNSEYKHHELPAVDKRKDRNNLNFHAIPGDVSKGMSYASNDVSEQEHLTLSEVDKRKDGFFFNSHTNTWKLWKDMSNNTENRTNEGQTNNGTQPPLAENQNVNVMEIAESEEEEDKNRESKDESKRKTETVRISIDVPVAVVSPTQDKCADNAYGNCNIKRQVERYLSAPETRKGSDKNSVLIGAENSEIDWFKIFKDLVPILPVNDHAWKFFAFELFHFTQQSCGLPKDIHNEVEMIQHSENHIHLRYHSVLKIWYRFMANEASLDQIEHSLERFDNNIIMQEFSEIKRNPPRKLLPQNNETSVMRWRQNEQFKPNSPPSVFTYVQHESTYETADGHRRLSHIRDRQFVQLTHLPAATTTETSQTCPLDSPRLALEYPQRCKQEYVNENNACHKVRGLGSKVKKKTQRKKLKKKLKERKVYRKAYEDERNDNITLIKKILPHDQIHLSRKEYNKFLDYTVDVIMKHNNVTRKTVLSITYELYTEIAETTNGERYILYSGRPNLNLDKEQYDCLVFYVKYARSRVLREIAELEAIGDTLFLFISYDGKPAAEVHQKQPQLKKSKYLLSRHDSDCYSSSTGDSSTESDSSEVNGMEIGVDLCSQASETSANSTKHCNPYESILYGRTIHEPQKYENDTSLNKEYNISIPQHSATVSTEQGNNEQRDESNVVEDNEVAAVVNRLPESDTETENETSSVCAYQ